MKAWKCVNWKGTLYLNGKVYFEDNHGFIKDEDGGFHRINNLRSIAEFKSIGFSDYLKEVEKP